MKLTIEFNGDIKGFELKQLLEADITQDAEALGYITSVLFETSKVLADYMKKVNPKYHERLGIGVLHAQTEKEKEKNAVYPFTTFVIRDE